MTAISCSQRRQAARKTVWDVKNHERKERQAPGKCKTRLFCTATCAFPSQVLPYLILSIALDRICIRYHDSLGNRTAKLIKLFISCRFRVITCPAPQLA